MEAKVKKEAGEVGGGVIGEGGRRVKGGGGLNYQRSGVEAVALLV